MTSYERGYGDGWEAAMDAARSEIRAERDAEWAEALGELAAIFNAWRLAEGHGEPNAPDEVRAWVDALARGLYGEMGYPRNPSELPERLRLTYDPLARDDHEAEQERQERDRLMGEFWTALTEGLPTSGIELQLARLDVPQEWVENTRAAARSGA